MNKNNFRFYAALIVATSHLFGFPLGVVLGDFNTGSLNIMVNKQNPWLENYSIDLSDIYKEKYINFTVENVGTDNVYLWERITNSNNNKGNVDMGVFFSTWVCNGAINGSCTIDANGKPTGTNWFPIISETSEKTISEINDTWINFADDLPVDWQVTVSQMYRLADNNLASGDNMDFDIQIEAYPTGDIITKNPDWNNHLTVKSTETFLDKLKDLFIGNFTANAVFTDIETAHVNISIGNNDINHAPTFTAVTNDGSANPGDTSLTITATAYNDTDTEEIQDTVSMYVCKQPDFTGTGCGSGGDWCHVTGVIPGNTLACDLTIPNPQAHGTINYYPYLIDSHGLPASGGKQGAKESFTVNDVAPTVSGTPVLNNANAIILSSGATTDVFVTGVISDDNGCADIVSANTFVDFWLSSLGRNGCDSTGEADINNCYYHSSCEYDRTVDACNGANDKTAGYKCKITFQNSAYVTNGAIWTATLIPGDGQGWSIVGEANAATQVLKKGGSTGDFCDADSYCQSGKCENDACIEPKLPGGSACTQNSQCQGGQCDNGYCSEITVNKAPSFAIMPHEDPVSDDENPTATGSNLAFKATAIDDNGDQWYLAICKTMFISPGSSGGTPICGGGAWAISPLTNSGSEAVATHTIGSLDALLNGSWYAFACDNKTGISSCSPMSNSGTTGNNGSPFAITKETSQPAIYSVNSPSGLLRIREGSGLTSAILKTVSSGWLLTRIGNSETTKDGYTWWQVKESDYEKNPTVGYAAKELLELNNQSNLPPNGLPQYYSDAETINDRVNWAKSMLGTPNWIKNNITLCMKFAQDAFNVYNSDWICPNGDGACPQGGINKLIAENKLYIPSKSFNPKIGSLLLFSIQGEHALKDYGHIGIYEGNSKVIHISTDGAPKESNISDFTSGSFYKFEGWAFPEQLSPLTENDVITCRDSNVCHIRKNHGLGDEADIIKSLSAGESVEIIDDPDNWLYRDNYHWWRVQFGGNQVDKGWAAEQVFKVKINSPGNIIVFDSQGRITGIESDVIKTEIPFSVYNKNNEEVGITSLFMDTYRTQVKGTETGFYGLVIDQSGKNSVIIDSIPIIKGEIHEYKIDWNKLENNGRGIEVKIDKDGNGTFEKIYEVGNNFHFIDVNAGGDISATSGNAVQFEGTYTDPAATSTQSIVWEFGDGETAEGTLTPAHAYYKAGNYTATLTVTDDDGGVGSDTVNITVNPIAAALNCEPGIINTKTNGNWVTCYVKMSAGYDPGAIDGSTIQLNGLPAYLGKQDWATASGNSANTADFDIDGIIERMFKFDRTALAAALGNSTSAELKIYGGIKLEGGVAEFEASQTIQTKPKK